MIITISGNKQLRIKKVEVDNRIEILKRDNMKIIMFKDLKIFLYIFEICFFNIC